MNTHVSYAKTVLKHKWFVMIECFKVGLIWQGIIHDWTKFIPWIWAAYVDCFEAGNKAPEHFDAAWCVHQKEKHHWQSWVLIGDDGELKPLRMPHKYALEMVCDWRGAGRAYSGEKNPREWYIKNAHKMVLHYSTRRTVENMIGVDYFDFQILHCICMRPTTEFHPRECYVQPEWRTHENARN